MPIFPLVIRKVTASRRDRTHHKACIEANQPLYTMHSLLIFDVFTHNLRTSRIVYSRLNRSHSFWPHSKGNWVLYYVVCITPFWPFETFRLGLTQIFLKFLFIKTSEYIIKLLENVLKIVKIFLKNFLKFQRYSICSKFNCHFQSSRNFFKFFSWHSQFPAPSAKRKKIMSHKLRTDQYF